jgi:hypothetical protein
MHLFIDMDGVLCDFIGEFKRKFGVEFHDTNDLLRWKMVKAEPNLWAELDPFPGAVDFFHSIHEMNNEASTHKTRKIFLLTALPKSSFIGSAQNKLAWVKKHLGDHVTMIPCIGGYNKAGYIQSPGDILVDDMYEKNLIPWIQHGGVGVHHIEGSEYTPTFDKLRTHYMEINHE